MSNNIDEILTKVTVNNILKFVEKSTILIKLIQTHKYIFLKSIQIKLFDFLSANLFINDLET